MLIGAGQWDQEHRPSWVNIARPLAVNAEAVRREGGNLSREQFDAVVEAARRRFRRTTDAALEWWRRTGGASDVS